MSKRSPFDLGARLRAVSRELRARYDAANIAGSHSGDKGLRREDVLRDFLRDVLPPKYGVGRGEVVSAYGGISKQVDVVIYDALHAPMLHTSPTSVLFPAECVYAAIEVKGHLTTGHLDGCVANIASVKELDRTACSDHVDGHGIDSLPGAEAVIENPPPFCGVFAFESADLGNTIFPGLVERNRRVPRRLWMEFVAVLDVGIITHYTMLCSGKWQATGLHDDSEHGCSVAGQDTLLYFYLLLLTQINARHLFPPELALYAETFGFPQPRIKRLPFEREP